jgi:hypothetical protein
LIAIGLSQKTGILLRALDRECRNNHAAAALCRGREESRQLWQRVFLGMHPVPVGRFHHYHVGSLAFGWAGMHNFPWRDFLVAHPANVSREQKLSRLSVRF